MIIPIKIPKEQKDQIISSLQAYFYEERSEDLGNLETEQIVDFMIREIGPYIYNKAISDVRAMINQKTVQIDEELYSLEKPIQIQRK